MTRAQKYTVSSVDTSQQTIVMSPDTLEKTPVIRNPHSYERANQRCSWGWIAATLVGLAAFIFVMCIIFVPHSSQKSPYLASSIIGNCTPEQVNCTEPKGNIEIYYANGSVANGELVASYSELFNCSQADPTDSQAWFSESCSSNFETTVTDGKLSTCLLLVLEAPEWKPCLNVDQLVDKSKYHPNYWSVGCMIQGDNSGATISYTPRNGFPAKKFCSDLQPAVLIKLDGLAQNNLPAELNCWIQASNAFCLRNDGKMRISITSGLLKVFSTTETIATTVTGDLEVNASSTTIEQNITTTAATTTTTELTTPEFSALLPSSS